MKKELKQSSSSNNCIFSQDIQSDVSRLPEDEWHTVSNRYLSSGNWSEAPLVTFRARRFHTCSHLPVLGKLLRQWRSVSSCRKCTAKVVRLSAGAHLLPHCGPTNVRLRLHLPLQVPSDCSPRMRVGAKSEVRWEEGRWIAFDDSYEKELWNGCQGKENDR